MSDPKTETGSEPRGNSGGPRGNELAAAIPGVIVGVVIATISDLSAPLRLVVAALLAVVYWSWPRIPALRRRASGEAHASATPEPGGLRERPPATSGADRLPSGRGWLGRGSPLAAALALAVVLNVLALVLVGGSLGILLFVVAWLVALAVPLQLAHLSESLRSTLYQATAASVGAALAIGAQLIIHDVTQPQQGKVVVPATADIFAAGQASAPDLHKGGGTLPPGRSVRQGSVVRFDAAGTVTCDRRWPFNGPDGGRCYGDYMHTSPFGSISGIVDGQGFLSLLGVFTSDPPPEGSPPPSLDFSAAAIGHNFLRLEPALNQVFFIGDGKTSGASADQQQFIVPRGATHLYLGFYDLCPNYGTRTCYDNNVGHLDVRIKVAASTAALPYWGRVAPGNLTARPHGTVLNTLPLHGSSHRIR